MSDYPLPYETEYTQNRELSWLRFNQRVMEEASDLSVPLFERMKFLDIFTRNLDEFFMIRVGSLLDLSHLKSDTLDNKTGWTPQEQLQMVFHETAPLYEQRDRLFFELEESFAALGVQRMEMDDLEKSDLEFVENYFRKNILPILSPQIIGAHHPFPHLWNKVLYVVASVRYKDKNPTTGLVDIPSVLSKLLILPGEDGRYVLTEHVVLHCLEEVFPEYEVTDPCIVSVTRNADIDPSDEAFDFDEDFRSRMKQILKMRSKLAPVRLEVQGELGKKQRKLLFRRLELVPEQVYSFEAPIGLDYIFELKRNLPSDLMEKWMYPEFISAQPFSYRSKESMIGQVQEKDMLLFFPYDSIDPFIHLLKESAASPKVQSIKITIYRLAPNSRIIKYLTDAAENGKEVTVLIELRARFDEENNIEWAELLEEAGCKVIYGTDECKVHSKVCLITLVDDGSISYITQIGTGNYNEETAKLYTDLSLLTADRHIGEDAAMFFMNMLIDNLEDTYSHLLVSPNGFHKKLLSLIDDEMEKVKCGGKGKILFKMNSLTEREVIDKLSQASCAGVEIILMIRGICCLLPGVSGKTENIHVFSIVGRFLEHPRIYCFGTGEERKVYISSADLMTRNLHRRVEISCLVLDPDAKKRIVRILETGLKDNVKSRGLTSKGNYVKVAAEGENEQKFNSQEHFVQEAVFRKNSAAMDQELEKKSTIEKKPTEEKKATKEKTIIDTKTPKGRERKIPGKSSRLLWKWIFKYNLLTALAKLLRKVG